MAKHVEHLLDIILSSEFKDIIDADGRPVVPSADIYQKISDRMNNDVTPKYIYVIVQNNRYKVLDKILLFHNIVASNSFTESIADISAEDSWSIDRVLKFTIKFPHKVWVTMSPEEVIYSDKSRTTKRYGTLQRKIWTDKIYESFYNETKLPCPISFKRCKIADSGMYVTVAGSCQECGCTFSGYIVNKPMPQSDVSMECSVQNYDPTIQHVKKRQLKGQRRVEVSKALTEGKELPCVWRRNQADKIMDFGDDEPAHLPNIGTLRKAKQERKDKILGLTQGIDPLQSIVKMKLDQHTGAIHGIALDPFFVHYWTPEQMATYVQYPHSISIDATGSLVKKLNKPNAELSPHIYLYQIVCETPSSKMPVFQMLSAVQNTNAIQYWLFEILRIGSFHKANFPHPREVICDFDKALMGAVARAFGQCKDLRDYLSKCLLAIRNTDAKLPASFLRLDIAHFVACVTRWKVLASVHPRVKIFYVTVMCLLTKITDFASFKKTVKSAIILCTSQECGMTENGSVSSAEEARVSIIQKIKGIPDPSQVYSTENKVTTADPVGDQVLDNSDDEILSDNNSAIDSWAHQFVKKCMDDTSNALNGVDINPYYCPMMVQKIKLMLPYFPLYSGVMISKFGYGKINASSSAVESEFNDLKHRLLKNDIRPMRVDKFLTTHIRSFSGRAKLAVATNNIRQPIIEQECVRSIVNQHDSANDVTNQNMRAIDLDDNEEDQNVACLVEGCEEMYNQDKDRKYKKNEENVDECTEGKNTNDKVMIENCADRVDHVIDLTCLSAVSTPISKIGKRSLNSQGLKTVISELTEEQNWRNKNGAKRAKRFYLDPRPDWNTVGFDAKRLSIGVLQNGNLCPMISEKEYKIVVLNTCGFDSIMQILAAACRIEQFSSTVSTGDTDTFLFLRYFLKNGVSNNVYRMRANILKRIECFIREERTPGVICVDALSNICNLCDYVFCLDWSYIEQFICNVCKKKASVEKTLSPINIDVLQTSGYTKLKEALLEGGFSERKCCGKMFHTSITYGSQLFIECNDGSGKKAKAEEFPESIQLQEVQYTLAGFVMYEGGTSITSVGHYTAWVKCRTEWVEYDDLKPKPLCPPKDAHKKTPELCIYVRT